jgi:hypothetical protein
METVKVQGEKTKGNESGIVIMNKADYDKLDPKPPLAKEAKATAKAEEKEEKKAEHETAHPHLKGK